MSRFVGWLTLPGNAGMPEANPPTQVIAIRVRFKCFPVQDDDW
jgi:hypothetical protein